MSGLASNRRTTRLEWAAEDFEEVAELISSGRLVIRGADPDEVRSRVLAKAAACRRGERVVRPKKRSYGFGSSIPLDDLVEEESGSL